MSPEKNRDIDKRHFSSLYIRVKRLIITLTFLMAVLIAFSVIRAARMMIFDAYRESVTFGMKTLGSEMKLTCLKPERVKNCFTSARQRLQHNRIFILLKDEKPVAISGDVKDLPSLLNTVKAMLKLRDFHVEMRGFGPFIKLTAALRLDKHHILVMREDARFIAGTYVTSAILILLIAITSAMAITSIFSKMIFTPMMTRLEDIKEALRRYGAGDSNVRLKTGREYRDEFDLVCDEFNRMADTIEELKHELTLRLKSERQLLSTLAHDINTPVTILRGHAENLLEHGGELSRRNSDRISAAILSQAIYIQNLVDDLLTMAKSKVSKLTLLRETIVLDDILDNIVNTFQPLADQEGITIFADGNGLELEADPVRLSQILNNLVMNVIRHATGASLMEIIAERHEEGIMLTVTDNGAGLQGTHAAPEQTRDRDALEKKRSDTDIISDSTEKKYRTGTRWGLGISIVKMLAEMHDGWFRYGPNPVGQGAMFTVWFPERK
jgi:signal transduction histidine kinase